MMQKEYRRGIGREKGLEKIDRDDLVVLWEKRITSGENGYWNERWRGGGRLKRGWSDVIKSDTRTAGVRSRVEQRFRAWVADLK